MANLAVSPYSAQVSMMARRDSPVIGGALICTQSGLSGDEVGARELGELFRAERMGLQCWAGTKKEVRTSGLDRK